MFSFCRASAICDQSANVYRHCSSYYARTRLCAFQVCCSVLQCVLQCVAVCCSVFQCVAVCWHTYAYTYAKCTGTGVISSVLQCVADCCSVLRFVAVRWHTYAYTYAICTGTGAISTRGYGRTGWVCVFVPVDQPPQTEPVAEYSDAGMLCVAVCYSVCCSVLQYVAMCCKEWASRRILNVAMLCVAGMQCVAVFYSVL